MSTFKDQDPLSAPARDTWLRRTNRELTTRMRAKFTKGHIQYGCDFGMQTIDYLLDAMEEEAIDQLMYVREMKRRREIEKVQQSTLAIDAK